MEEIKRRTTAISDIQTKKRTTSFQATNIEFTCLQFRKILELISLGSLIANVKEFEKQQVKYQKYWHAERILNDIERVNPDYYPQPIQEVPHPDPNIKNDLQPIKDGYLTKKEFVRIYEKCGKIMHADNPFGSKVDLDYYEKQYPIWHSLIRTLMNTHLIKLINDENLYLIHMTEARDNKAHGYTFGPIKTKK